MGQRVVVEKIVQQALMGETAIFEITMDSLEEKGIHTFPLSPSHDVKSLKETNSRSSKTENILSRIE